VNLKFQIIDNGTHDVELMFGYKYLTLNCSCGRLDCNHVDDILLGNFSKAVNSKVTMVARLIIDEFKVYLNALYSRRKFKPRS
jgi:hypothetical protein